MVPKHHILNLDFRRPILLSLPVLAVVCFLLIALGSNFSVVLVAALCVLAGFLCVSFLGWFNVGAIVVLAVAVRHVDLAMILKVLHLQPLDSNLHYPFLSFVVAFVGLMSLATACLLANLIPTRVRLLPQVNQPRSLFLIGICASAIGIAAYLVAFGRIDAIASGAQAGGTTYEAFFSHFILLGIIAFTAHTIMISKGERIIGIANSLMIAFVFASAFAANSRAGLILPIVAVGFTVIAFRARIRAVHVMAVVFAGLAYTFILSPAILEARATRSSQGIVERVIHTIEIAVSKPLTLASRNQRTAGSSNLQYFGYSDVELERLAQIQHTDFFVAQVQSHGSPIGLDGFWASLRNVLPSVIAGNKDTSISGGSYLRCQFGWWVECEAGRRSTAPIISASYAMAGWSGVILLPFLCALPIFVLMRLQAPSFHMSIWGAFLVTRGVTALSEANVDAYLLYTRFLLQDLIIMIAISLFVDYLNRRVLRPASHPQEA